VSRPRAVLAETRTIARKVDTLAERIEALTIAVAQLRAGQPSQLGRVEDACRILNVSPATLHRRIKDGSIQAIRRGRALRFDLTKLAASSEAHE
jgi:excisionase family DNA binding protein